MKKKLTRKEFSDLDKFDRKQKKHPPFKEKDSKSKLSIYEDFDEEELDKLYSTDDENEEDY